MALEAEVLRDVLKAARVTAPQLALLLQVDPEEVAAIQRGERPEPGLLEACARLLGVTLEELYARKVGAPAALFRSFEGVTPKMQTLADEGAALTIGGYVQDLHKALLLDGAGGAGLPPWATYRRIEDGSIPPHGGDELAREVRDRLDLGVDPIPSMWRLAQGLGARCAAVTPDELSATITGVSWRDQNAPCLVVNVVGAWWKTRMNVAHELGHLLFDLPNLGVVWSGDRRAKHYELFAAVEQRANAFAAQLLVPPEGVRKVVGHRDPADAGIVRHLSAVYQVRTFVACDVLSDTFGLSRSVRLALREKVRDDRELAPSHLDGVAPPSPRAQLVEAVQRAMAAARIGRVRARTMLGLAMSDPLPFGEDEPLLGLRERIECAVGEYLHRTRRTHLAPTDVNVLPDDSYEVTLESAAPEGSCPSERLRLSRDMVVLDAGA